ncbi:S8 family serine peptidase [Aquimarina hainanensis]|uniref:S8 family serine peptidase n=1 Tax=Aquimarina hainanensis TaxID=1578017 RepID=A0ABW5NB70_9FLAO
MNRLYNFLGVILLLIYNYSFSQSSDCPENLTVTTDVLSGQTRLFQSSNSITGVNTIQTNANAIYNAGVEITLSDGFDAIKGADFDALIDGCISNPNSLPNDPLFTLQWGHHNLGSNSPENHPYAFSFHTDCATAEITPPIGVNDIDTNILDVWKDITKGSEDITIAILDSGLDIHHPDINPNRIVAPQNFTETGTITDVTDTGGHGTHVAGLIAAEVNNGIGIAGIDQNCKIMPVKINPSPGKFIQISKGIRYAISQDRGSNKANIISMSLGKSTDFTKEEEVKNAVSEAIEAGAILIAATGNDNTNKVDFPAQYSEVIGVGALSPCNTRKSRTSCDLDTRKEGRNLLSWGSNYGVGMDILAPGTLIPSTDITGINQGLSGFCNCALGSCYTSCIKTSNSNIFTNINGDYVIDGFGTSIATPYVAGIASLMLAANKDLKNYQVQYILKESAKITSDGFKRVDALSAVEMAKNFDPNIDFLLPDLKIEVLSEISDEIDFTDTFPIEIKITNRGDKVISSSSLQLSFKIITDINDNISKSFDISSISVTSLGINQSQIKNVSIRPICTDISGEINDILNRPSFLSISINNNNDEISKLNNQIDIPIQFIENQKPDLVIENVTLANTLSNSFLVEFDIKNLGQGHSELVANTSVQNNFYNYYLSEDIFLDKIKDRKIFPRFNQVNPIYGNFSLCPKTSQTLRPNRFNHSPEGYLFIEINANNIINEIDRTNNIIMINLTQSNSATLILRSKNPVLNPGAILSISPNPSKDMVSILVPKKGIIRVLDITGVLISSYPITDSLLNINIGSYKKGLYLVEYIDIGGNRSIKKLIKK